MAEKILAALASLDPKKDDHWTVGGEPRIDVVKTAAGDQAITRDDIVAAAPTFNRAAAAAGTAPAAAPVAGSAPGVKAAGSAPPAPPAPKVAPPPAAPPAKGDPEAIARATEALADAQDELGEMDEWIAKAQEERKRRSAVADAAQRALDALQPIQTSGDAIQAYLARQRSNLQERGAAIARAKQFRAENGFSLDMLLPQRAKVDAVRSRRMGHGNVRPPVPGSK